MSVPAHSRSASTTRLAETRTGTARPLLCFVYSPTSGPSRRAEGFLAQVLQRRKNHRAFVVQRVNWVERPDLAKKLGTESVPSLVVVQNRRVCARLEGVRGCRDIERLLEPWLGCSDGDQPSAESLDGADEATPPSPAPVPEPYPPPDELDLPSPDPDDGDAGDDE
jgi:thioredoxin-like negative regulator of GroEL